VMGMALPGSVPGMVIANSFLLVFHGWSTLPLLEQL